MLLLLSRQPLFLFVLFFWLFWGGASFKAKIAKHVTPNPELLPHNLELMAKLQKLQEQGRRLVLVTAAHENIAQSVSKHVELFSEVFGSCESLILKGETKVKFLVKQYGVRGFDYIGDSKAGIPVWKQARHVMRCKRYTLFGTEPKQHRHKA